MIVPVFFVVPVAVSGAFGTPRSYSCVHSLPSRRISTSSHSLSALTTEMPTPWRPPDTLYAECSNLPPECSTVRTTSAADLPLSLWMSTGIPRPLSPTEHEPSPCRTRSEEHTSELQSHHDLVC